MITSFLTSPLPKLTTVSQNRSKKYRPDIDGLRAVAVVGVVVYHMQSVEFLPGGFLGVDIFFVISGFLITAIILTGIQEKTFSFKRFYIRRARRLLPAFFLVAIATLGAAYVFLEPTRMLDFTHSLVFSMVGMSNFYFMFQDPYWADSASTLPFLHTWSLAVEEQFYLFFPAALLVASQLFDKSRRTLLFAALGFFSLLLAITISSTNPTFAFYLFPTRAWELIIGVTLALVIDQVGPRIPKLLAGLSTALGVALVGISYVYLGQFISGPGVLTMVPTFGAAFIIMGGTTANPISKILGWRPFAGLGLISYSLYLWHYPILALFEVGGAKSFTFQMIGVGLAILLSFATYSLVEIPFRHKIWNARFTIVASGTIFLTLLTSMGSLVTSGYNVRTVPEALTVGAEEPDLSLRPGQNLSGHLSLFGDSHMRTLVSTLREESQDAGFSFMNGTLDSCLFALGLARENLQKCDVGFQESRMDAAETFSPAFVVIGGRYPLALEGRRFDNEEGGIEIGGDNIGNYNFFSPGTKDFSHGNMTRQLAASTQRTAEGLLEQGNVVVLVYPILEVGWSVPEEIKLRAFQGESGPKWLSEFQEYSSTKGIRIQWDRFSLPGKWPLDEPVTTSYNVYVERTRSTFELFDSISGDNIVRVYPHKIFCDYKGEGRCFTHSDTEVWYSDDDHLSASGAELLSSEIMKAIAAWRTERH